MECMHSYAFMEVMRIAGRIHVCHFCQIRGKILLIETEGKSQGKESGPGRSPEEARHFGCQMVTIETQYSVSVSLCYFVASALGCSGRGHLERSLS